MIKLLFPLPRQVTVAFSGGIDSVAVVDFLSNNHDVTCAFYHHGTENSDRAFEFVTKFCEQRKLVLYTGYNYDEKPKDQSLEEFWRNKRYEFLAPFDNVITAHHLDDCVETYLWSCMHGNPKVIQQKRNNVLRPFLTTPKREFQNWCRRRELEWCEDKSNDDTKYTRNYIRHVLMPHALKVNPGLPTVVKKLIEKQI